MVVSLAATMQGLTSSVMVVGLEVRTVSLHHGVDAGENSSLLWDGVHDAIGVMSFLKATLGIFGANLGSCLGPTTWMLVFLVR